MVDQNFVSIYEVTLVRLARLLQLKVYQELMPSIAIFLDRSSNSLITIYQKTGLRGLVRSFQQRKQNNG
jgi:hypothetical protein